MIQFACIAVRLASALACAGPQEPVPPDLARLALQVDRAHHPDGKVQPVQSFTAALSIEQVAAEAKERLQVELKARFLEWRDNDRARPLLRVELLGTSHPTVRGRDRSGYWLLVGGKPEDLEGRDSGQDKDDVVRDIRLARQLVRLLDPGAVLRALKNPTAVGQEELKIGREPGIPCDVVSGELAGFPTRTSAVEERPVQLKAWVARGQGRVVAVDVTPIEGGKPRPRDAERVQLEETHVVDQVLLPQRLTWFAPDADGKWRVQMHVNIADIHLNPNLGPDDFDRQKH